MSPKHLFLALIFLLTIISVMQEASAESFKETQIKKLGGKVSETIDDQGNKITRIEFPSGVTIEKSPQGSVGMDGSGRGAVLCTWEIYIQVRGMLETCSTKETLPFRVLMDKGINRINDFIVENSLEPISKKQLQTTILKKMEKTNKDKSICQSEDWIKIMQNFTSQAEDFNKSIELLLAVPRPPVMNPCL